MTRHRNPIPCAVGIFCILSLSACVTTRQQLNEERGVRTSASGGATRSAAVQSEDLAPVPTPSLVTSAPPVTANPPGEYSASTSAPTSPQTSPQAQAMTSTSTSAPQAVPPAANSYPVVPPPTGGGYSLEEIRAEMARLSGKVEELEHEKRLREEARAEEQRQLQEKIAQLEKQLQESQAPKGPPLPEGKSPFEAGKDAYFNERYEDTIAFMDQAIAAKDTGKQAEEAYYLKGESYFKLKNHQQAILNYSKFPEKFPKSQYHSKALLRIAECFDAMGMKEDAKAFYQNLVDQFPKTAEGKLAKKRLAPPKKK